MTAPRAPAICFAIPGDIATLTGGYIYDRRVIDALRSADVPVDHVELPSSFPFPGEEDVKTSMNLLQARRKDAALMIDGLAFGALPHEQARSLGAGVIALCHHPLGLENGLPPEKARYLLENEKLNLQGVAHVIVSSETTARTLVADFGISGQCITVAEPGADPMPRAIGGQAGMVELLSVGSIIERKGYDLLLEALADVPDLPWRLRIAGSLDRSPQTAAKIRALADRQQMQGRVEVRGEVSADELAGLYAGSDVFVLASHYEGYGMVLAEAMASGLAIISTTGGAAAATVPDDAALKVPPGDGVALRDALRRVIGDTALRRSLSGASWQAGQKLPRWPDTAKIIAGVAARVAGDLVP